MEASQELSKKPNKIKLDFKDSKYATGRRKRSIAKVWLKKGSGKIYVNGQGFETYFKRDTHKMQILRPFEIINQPTDYDVRCNVVGGGHTGQAGAMVLGISKALLLLLPSIYSEIKRLFDVCVPLIEKKLSLSSKGIASAASEIFIL